MKDPVKILFITQEITPYLPESALANICRELPQHVQEQGYEIRIFMPCYGHINERRNQLHEVQRLSGMNLIINDCDHPLIIKVASIQAARMQVYFIDNDDYFRRRGISSDDDNKEYEDNDDRTVFYARGVLETIKKLRWTPDIIHCHGWMTALAPLYIKKAYNDDPFFSKSKIVYSVYDDDFKENFREGFTERIAKEGVSEADLKSVAKKDVSFVDLSKLAIDFADAVVAASPQINPELEAYAREKGIIYAPYDEDFKTNYIKLYDSLFPGLGEDI